jgi:hypothetical protein
MAKQTSGSSFVGSPKKSRKGVHAKTRNSKNKNSKNYVKKNVGQGR